MMTVLKSIQLLICMFFTLPAIAQERDSVNASWLVQHGFEEHAGMYTKATSLGELSNLFTFETDNLKPIVQWRALPEYLVHVRNCDLFIQILDQPKTDLGLGTKIYAFVNLTPLTLFSPEAEWFVSHGYKGQTYFTGTWYRKNDIPLSEVCRNFKVTLDAFKPTTPYLFSPRDFHLKLGEKGLGIRLAKTLGTKETLAPEMRADCQFGDGDGGNPRRELANILEVNGFVYTGLEFSKNNWKYLDACEFLKLDGNKIDSDANKSTRKCIVGSCEVIFEGEFSKEEHNPIVGVKINIDKESLVDVAPLTIEKLKSLGFSEDKVQINGTGKRRVFVNKHLKVEILLESASIELNRFSRRALSTFGSEVSPLYAEFSVWTCLIWPFPGTYERDLKNSTAYCIVTIDENKLK